MADPNPELVEMVAQVFCDLLGDNEWELYRDEALAAIRVAGEWAAGVANNCNDPSGIGDCPTAAAIRKEFGVDE